MSTKTTLMMVAALTTSGLASAVSASPVYTPTSSPNTQAEAVSLVGLDLHSEQGAKLALFRIRQAAKDVCGVPADVGPIWANARPNMCVIAVVNRAVAELDDPSVTALNSAHGKTGAQLAAGGR